MACIIAVPSKGRLREKSLYVMASAGFPVIVPKDDRTYQTHVAGRPEIEIAFLSASEIARELDLGTVDAGITGMDLVGEKIPSANPKPERVAKLGFGHADVVVAVPDPWQDVYTMAELGELAASFRATHGRRLRIATKYWQLTQKFFSSEHGIQLYRIIESLGATEGAPAAGQADIIVDITSTGSTIRANKLRVLDDGVIMKSEACLFRSARRPENEILAQIRKALL
ncbi:MAG: ATP phosphoribosyltransferase [Pseudomonadota bacterium]